MEPLSFYTMESLWHQDHRIVTVHMFNPYVSDYDIELFLFRYCYSVSGRVLIRDKNGIWTGKRQFRVNLKPDKESYDGFKHPPANFSIGPNRGYLFYSGQPQYCRKCGRFGHLAASCEDVICRNCQGSGHESKDCSVAKKCSICNSEEHLFKHCPMRQTTYADAVREEELTEEEPAGQDAEKDQSQSVLATTQEMEEEQETEAGSSQETSASAVSCVGSIPGNQEHWKRVKGKRKSPREPSAAQLGTTGKKKVGGIPLSTNTYDALSDREEGEALEELPEERTKKEWGECVTDSSDIGDSLEIIKAECLALSKGHISKEQSSPGQDCLVEGEGGLVPAQGGKKKGP